jgi:cell division protein FtsB
VILFLFVRGKMRARDQLEYELQRVRYEMELAHLEEKTEASDQKIKELERQEETIKEKIRLVEEREIQGEELSVDELEDFFADRGF